MSEIKKQEHEQELNEETCQNCENTLENPEMENLQSIDESSVLEQVELKLEPQNIAEEVTEVEEIIICRKCGKAFEEGQEFCSNCGTPKTGIKYFCENCGAELKKDEKFCSKCGCKAKKSAEMIINSSMDKVKDTVEKTKESKKTKKIIIVAVVLAVIALAGKLILPKIFVSTENLLAEGNYQKAFEKTKDEEQVKVIKENIVAFLSENTSKNMKNPDSFKLQRAWCNDEYTSIVLEITGTNSYGGIVSNYWMYVYDTEEQEYTIFGTVSELSEEEYSEYDDEDEMLEKLIDNITRDMIKSIKNTDEFELESKSIKNINSLFEKDILDTVELLDIVIDSEEEVI